MKKLTKILTFIMAMLAFSSCLGISAFEAPLDDYCYKPEFEPRTYVWPYARKPQPPTIRPSFRATPPRPQGRFGRPNTPPNGKGAPRGGRR